MEDLKRDWDAMTIEIEAQKKTIDDLLKNWKQAALKPLRSHKQARLMNIAEDLNKCLIMHGLLGHNVVFQ